MASRSHSHNPFDLEITIISAKHLKNVNWRNGDLKPYATIYLDNSDHRLATHADDSGSTRPVWNERFTLPVTRLIADSVLTLEILHSRPSETPKPLVGAVKIPLSQILDSVESPIAIRAFELIRPSGRPHGKVRLKLALKERPMPPPPPPPQQQVSPQIHDYHSAPNYSHYYTAAPPPPSPAPMANRDYREFSSAPYNYHPDQYGYYSAYYPPQPPLPSRPLYNRASSYNLQSGPSAPVDISAQLPPPPPHYDHKTVPQPSVSLSKTSGYGGVPSGPSAPVDYSSQYGSVKGGATELSSCMGGLNLEESGSNYEKEKAPDRESFGGYRHEY